MNNDQARIKLAEAMGYVTTRKSVEWHGEVWEGKTPHGEATWNLPDPFTDANDDYAVEDFMLRGNRTNSEKSAYKDALYELITDRIGTRYPMPWDARIGDRARAALKALETA